MTTRALPLSSQSRLRTHQTKETHYSCLSRARTAAVCDMSLLMLEIDLSEGEDNPPCLKRTRRGFPHPSYKASSVCALRCSGAANSCVYVRSQAIAVVAYFSRELIEKTFCIMFGFHYKRCPSNCTRLILRPENLSRFSEGLLFGTLL